MGLDTGDIFNRELKEIKIGLESNDTLLFYTDGLTEARNQDGDEFGEKRLLKAVLEKKSSNVRIKQKTILDSLNTFLDGIKPQDDITMILIDCNF
jgi:serine phosphatase RsbU (regulator of sigma subunit)